MAASLACVTTAFGAHAASGGQTPRPTTVVIALVLSGAVAWLIAGVRLTALQMLGLLVLCQSGAHIASMASDAGAPASMGWSMLTMHAVATAVSLAALVKGESFVWAVAHRLALRPWRALLHPVVVPSARTTIVSIPATRPHGVRAARVTPVRGPPTGFASVVPSL